MLPKKTFTMSYILKRAITKNKSSPPKNTSLPGGGKAKKSKGMNDEGLSNIKYPNQESTSTKASSLRPSPVRCFGDIFLLKDPKKPVFPFGLLNEVKQVREIVVQSNSYFDFTLNEANFCQQERLQNGAEELRSLDSLPAKSLANVIEKSPCFDFESFCTEEKEEPPKRLFESLNIEIQDFFEKEPQKLGFVLQCEVSSHGIEISRVVLNTVLMELVHNVEAEDLGKVVRNYKLPDFLGLTHESYYEIAKFVFDPNQAENCFIADLKTEDQNKIGIKLFCNKKGMLCENSRKSSFALFFRVEADQKQMKELEKLRKNKKLTAENQQQKKEIWANLIDRYYDQPKEYEKEDPVSESRRCRFKLIE